MTKTLREFVNKIVAGAETTATSLASSYLTQALKRTDIRPVCTVIKALAKPLLIGQR